MIAELNEHYELLVSSDFFCCLLWISELPVGPDPGGVDQQDLDFWSG
jgi:hypothetical protein